MKVNIPKPCNENWTEMTPTEKGAFCNKCQIDVIDFSTKSNREIKALLLANKGKHLCGHISKSQIELLNYDYALWEKQSYQTFQSKFLMACVLVFGLALFSGCGQQDFKADESNLIEMVGGLNKEADSTMRGNIITNANDSSSCNLPHNPSLNPNDYLIDGEIVVDDSYYESIAP